MLLKWKLELMFILNKSANFMAISCLSEISYRSALDITSYYYYYSLVSGIQDLTATRDCHSKPTLVARSDSTLSLKHLVRSDIAISCSAYFYFLLAHKNPDHQLPPPQFSYSQGRVRVFKYQIMPMHICIKLYCRYCIINYYYIRIRLPCQPE